MPYRVLLLILALTPALASSATLDERLGDLEHAFKPDLDGTTSAKPASPPPERFKLAPLGSVVRKKECATSSLPDEQSSCAALEFVHGLRTVRWSAGNLTWRTTGPCRGSS